MLRVVNLPAVTLLPYSHENGGVMKGFFPTLWNYSPITRSRFSRSLVGSVFNCWHFSRAWLRSSSKSGVLYSSHPTAMLPGQREGRYIFWQCRNSFCEIFPELISWLFQRQKKWLWLRVVHTRNCSTRRQASTPSDFAQPLRQAVSRNSVTTLSRAQTFC